MIDGHVQAALFWTAGMSVYIFLMHQDVAHSGLSAGEPND